MKHAKTYEEWKTWAIEEDRRSGADAWKSEESCTLYDHGVIRLRYDELVAIRRSGDAHRLLFYLNEGLHGNMGGMGSSALYAHARFGTKQLVSDYIEELTAAILDLEAVEEHAISLHDKVGLLRRAQACFGRSALMLSGAGSLGSFHIGVARALAEHDLVPSVVSGASAGSIVAAMIGTHAPDALQRLFSDDVTQRAFAVLRGGDGAPARRRILEVDKLEAMIESIIPDLTFIEAFEETGRQINVAVAPAQLHQRSRLLNAATSPNACIREAVLASCAVPGLFPPVTLAAKDASGRRQPYVPSRQWVDGSITDDMPARRLARLYSVNHFISSQANPVTLWATLDPHAKDTLLSQLTGIYVSASQDLLRAVYPFAMSVVRDRHPVDFYARLLFSVLTQNYAADVNIVPSRRFYEPSMVLSSLSPREVEDLVADGERATWPKIEIIRNCTQVSRCIDGVLKRLETRIAPSEAVSA